MFERNRKYYVCAKVRTCLFVELPLFEEDFEYFKAINKKIKIKQL